MAPEKNKKVTVAIIIIVMVMAVISLTGIIFFRVKPQILQGQIETDRVTISGKLLGRIEGFHVREGQTVAIGDTLVRINSPETAAQLTTASAMENVARYQNNKVDAGARSEIIKSLKQALDAAKANYTLAKATKERIEKLYLDSIVTSQKMDEVNALYKNAESAKNAAEYQYEMALNGAQIEDRQSARAMVAAASGGVMALEALLHDTELISPVKGEVGSIYPSVGELVMPGTPIMEIIVTDSCYVVLNVKETLLPHFGMGEKFKGKIPALGNTQYEFEVFYINPLGSFANWSSSKESGNYDIVTFQVKARPTKEKRLRPGMSVLVKLEK